MTQTERRRFLLSRLLAEAPEYRQLALWYWVHWWLPVPLRPCGGSRSSKISIKTPPPGDSRRGRCVLQ